MEGWPLAAGGKAAGLAMPAGSVCGSSRRLRDKFHAEDPASFEAVFGPGETVIVRDIERLLVNAGVHAAGLGGIEGDTPNGVAREARVSKLPSLARIFGEGNPDAPSRYRDPVPRGWIEGDVEDIP